MQFYIELGRVAREDLGYDHSLFRSFLKFKGDLEAKIRGSFFVVIRSEELPRNIAKRQRTRREYMANIKNLILTSSLNMQKDDKIEIEKGIVLVKVQDKGAEVNFWPHSISPLNIEKPSYVIKLLKEAAVKFRNYWVEGNQNALILLHVGLQLIRNNFNILLRDMKAGLLGKDLASLEVFKGLYAVYIIVFPSSWTEDITLIECYPASCSVRFCDLSDIFQSEKEYIQTYVPYFFGKT